MFGLFTKGKGYLIPIITFLVLVGTEYSVETLYNDDTVYQTRGWPIVLGFFIAALGIHLLNLKLNGQEYLQEKPQNKHLFLLIDIKHWTVLLPFIGMLFGVSIWFN